MYEWMLSIVGVICLGVLLEIVLPEGETSKYAKGAFSLLVIFVVVAPLPKLVQSDWKFDFEKIGFEVDQKYLDEVAVFGEEKCARDLENYLLVEGYTVSAKIVLKKGSLSDIERIDIDLTLGVLEMEDANKHIARVIEMSAKRLDADPQNIFVKIVNIGDDEYGSG